PNTYSAISLSDHRPASKGKRRSSRKHKPTLARAAADITASAKPRLNMNSRQRNTCRSYLVRPFRITTSTAFQVSTTATWRQLTASRPSFAPSLLIAIHRQSLSRCRSSREFHSRDETSGAKVVNYALEAKLEADAELIQNRLYWGFNMLYEPE